MKTLAKTAARQSPEEHMGDMIHKARIFRAVARGLGTVEGVGTVVDVIVKSGPLVSSKAAAAKVGISAQTSSSRIEFFVLAGATAATWGVERLLNRGVNRMKKKQQASTQQSNI